MKLSEIELKKRAKDNQIIFLKGREYQRMLNQKQFTKKHILIVFKELIRKLPNYRKPDDGNGDEDSFNHGYNQCIDIISKIILSEIENLK